MPKTICQVSARKMSLWSNGKIKTKGFRKNLLKELKNRDGFVAKEIKSCTMGIVPDAHYFEDNNVVIVELEDTNKLSFNRLLRYCEMWSVFDYELPSIMPRLIVMDRYGMNQREIDLMQYYHTFVDMQIYE